MKTKMILVSILSLGLSANSQTITSTNIAVFGDTVLNATDVAPSILIGTAGTGKTWNFSSLLTNSLDTAFFLHPFIQTSVGSAFPSATIATSRDTNLIFLRTSTSKLEIIGVSNGVTNAISTDPETVITFPSSYNTSFLDSAKTILVLSRAQAQPLVTITIPTYIDSIRIESNTSINSLMDASGTLTTPYGVFLAIRQNLTRQTQDNIYARVAGTWGTTPLLVQNDTAWSHQFWADDSLAKFPLVSYDITNRGNLSGDVVWITGYQKTSSIDEVTAKNISVFPNPATNNLTININETIEKVEVIDISGRVVYVNNVMNSNKLNIQSLQTGTYFLKVKTSEYVGVSKFIKR